MIIAAVVIVGKDINAEGLFNNSLPFADRELAVEVSKLSEPPAERIVKPTRGDLCESFCKTLGYPLHHHSARHNGECPRIFCRIFFELWQSLFDRLNDCHIDLSGKALIFPLCAR